MISLNEYLSIDGIIKKYLENIDILSPTRRQHFLGRLKLCNITNNTKEDDIQLIVDKIYDLCDKYEKKNYKYIVDKYVVMPYDCKGKEKVFNWLKTVDNKVAKYLSLGCISAELFILIRNNDIDKINIWNKIYNFYEDIDKFIELHNADPMGLKNINGTLYVNFIGNAYYILKDERLDFPKKISLDDWRKTRYYFCNSKDYSMSDVYGVTHAVINGTMFYTQLLDKEEFKNELEFLESFLKQQRYNDYKDVGDKYTLDLICEAALCDKLGNDPRYSEYVFTKKYLLENIDTNTGILQSISGFEENLDKNLEYNEHCNILLIFLYKYICYNISNHEKSK